MSNSSHNNLINNGTLNDYLPMQITECVYIGLKKATLLTSGSQIVDLLHSIRQMRGFYLKRLNDMRILS